MGVFAYRARELSGQEVRGTLSADNRQAALHQLSLKALLPLEVNEATAQAIRGRKVGLGPLGAFYLQFADLLNSGVPILRSLNVLAKQKSHPALTSVVTALHDEVAGGEALAECMAKHPAVFPALHVSIIAAAEKGGFLEDALQNLGNFVERQDELRGRVISAMIYPAILMVVGLGIFIAVVTWFVPQFKPILERVPNKMWLTNALFFISDLVREHWLLFSLLPAMVVFGLIAVLRNPSTRAWLDRNLLKIPLLGPVLTLISLCRFCRVLGTLLKNGIPILQALKTAQTSAGNVVIMQQIEAAAESVRKGETLSGPLAASLLFPPDIMDMIAVGEESNQLDKVLVQIADKQEARVARRVDTLVRLIEPIMLVIIAIGIALVAVALLVPVLTSSSAI